MPRTENQAALEAMAESFSEMLKPHGFTLKGRTYFRITEPGLTHLIDFELAQALSIYSDSFTVDLAVDIEEVRQVLYPKTTAKQRRIPNIMECEIRQRLSMLDPKGTDRFWSLSQIGKASHEVKNLGSADQATPEVSYLLSTYAVPFLNRYSNRLSILNEWKANKSDFGGEGATARCKALVPIILFAELGQTNESQKLLAQEYSDPNNSRRESYIAILKEIAVKYKIADQ